LKKVKADRIRFSEDIITEIYLQIATKLSYYFNYLKDPENKGNLLAMRAQESRQPPKQHSFLDEELLQTSPKQNENLEIVFGIGGTFHS